MKNKRGLSIWIWILIILILIIVGIGIYLWFFGGTWSSTAISNTIPQPPALPN
jgi:flagellar basal body-associated protein FliL